jgi:tetratricopeptide (TPR) repeat protein
MVDGGGRRGEEEHFSMKEVPEESAAAIASGSRARIDRMLALLDREPQDLQLRKEAIRAASDTRYWLAAHDLLETGLQQQPDDVELLALAQSLAPVEVRYELACALFEQRRYEEALRQLLPPHMSFDWARARLLRARCLHGLNRRVEAIADCRAHLALDAENPEANGLLALLLYERDQRGAVRRHIDNALRVDPRQCDALLAQASLQLDAQQQTLAYASFEALLVAHPNCGQAWHALALIELERLQAKAARDHMLLALKSMPDHIASWHVFAWIEIMLGRFVAAERAFQRALAADRTCGETHGGLAVTAALRGLENEARLCITRALKLDHDSVLARYAEMLLLEHAGRVKEARDALVQILGRPASRGELTYRDLVIRKLMRVRAQDTPPPSGEG